MLGIKLFYLKSMILNYLLCVRNWGDEMLNYDKIILCLVNFWKISG